MLGFDIRGKRKKEKWIKVERESESETDDFPEDTFIMEDDFEEEEKTQEEVQLYQN